MPGILELPTANRPVDVVRDASASLTLPSLSSLQRIKKLRAIIQKPDANAERPVTFWIAFPHSVKFEASIMNAGEAVEDLFVRATFSNNATQYFAIMPEANHCVLAGSDWLVNMPLTFSATCAWSGTASLLFCKTSSPTTLKKLTDHVAEPQAVELVVVKRLNTRRESMNMMLSDEQQYKAISGARKYWVWPKLGR